MEATELERRLCQKYETQWQSAYRKEDYWTAKELLEQAINEGDSVNWQSDQALQFRFDTDLALTCVQLQDYETADTLLQKHLRDPKSGGKLEGVELLKLIYRGWVNTELAAIHLKKGDFTSCLSELNWATVNTWEGCADKWDATCEMYNKIFASMLQNGASRDAAAHFERFFEAQKAHYIPVNGEDSAKSACLIPFLELALQMFNSLGDTASASEMQRLIKENALGKQPDNLRLDKAIERQRSIPAFVGQLMQQDVTYWFSKPG